MAESLYDTDALTWSTRQAELLRRLARGERVNAEIDWKHVVAEVRDVGRLELRAVRSLLGRALDHLMKIHGWRDGPIEHWRGEVLTFLADARRSYTPSMRRAIGLAAIYADSREGTLARTLDGRAPRPAPAECPYRLDDLLRAPLTPAYLDRLIRALEG